MGETGFLGLRVRCMRNLPASKQRRTSIWAKTRGRGPQVGPGRIPELLDQWVALQRLLDHAALDALPAPVNETYFAEPGLVGRADVLVDDRGDVAGREGVEIDEVFDRNPVNHVKAQSPKPKAQSTTARRRP